MLLDYLLHKVEQISIPLKINSAHCSRIRLGENECNDCFNACKFDAIQIDSKIDIQIDKCKGCLLCSAACKSEAISPEINLDDFEKLKISKNEIVLGCKRQKNIHHFRYNCIGWLSNEVLIYLSKTFQTVKIDITDCNECVNKISCETVNNNLRLLNDNEFAKNITLENNFGKITESSHTLDRRDFFRSVKGSLSTEVNSYIESKNEEKKYFSDTGLTLKRNAIFALKENKLVDEKLLQEKLSYHVNLNSRCNNCLDCTAICPTEALLDNDDEKLEINSLLCTGCNLCSDFCEEHGINISLAESSFLA